MALSEYTISGLKEVTVNSLNQRILKINNYLYQLTQEVKKLQGTSDYTPTFSNDIDVSGYRVTRVGKSQASTDACPRSELIQKGMYFRNGKHTAKGYIDAPYSVRVPDAQRPDEAVNLSQVRTLQELPKFGFKTLYLPASAMYPDSANPPTWTTYRSVAGWGFPDGVNSTVHFSFCLPKDFYSDTTFDSLYLTFCYSGSEPPAGSAAKVTLSYHDWYGNGDEFNASASTTSTYFLPHDSGSWDTMTHTIFLIDDWVGDIGDIIPLSLTRNGSHANDTYQETVILWGMTLRYHATTEMSQS